jgi:hypothetical protein
MRLFIGLSCIVGLGFVAEAVAQTKKDGITYQNVRASQCRSVCLARGWSADNCTSYCRPGSCKKAKTGGEHFCVVK